MTWMTMRARLSWRMALCVVAATLGSRAFAQEMPASSRFIKPSIEELAIPGAPVKETGDAGTREAMCLMIESAARSQDLPVEFFARVIWQESRFQSDAVGPVTRSGQRAQGIAQFRNRRNF
jgi:soluble lytic murein transglycosylase-like protein